MILTNKMGLPSAIEAAVRNDPYSSGDCDITVTQLLTPPYQRRLRKTVEEMEDVSDRIWSLIGQATHTILERAYKDKVPEGVLLEQRLYTDINGYRVGGQFDVIEDGTLYDYKVTSVWSLIGVKLEWEQQLNMLRLLAIRNGIEVNNLRIITILRDWSKGKANNKDYPQVQVVPVDIPVWSITDVEHYMQERVAMHMSENPEPCSDAERWYTGDVFAVMKDGRKSAIKLHETEEEALAHKNELGDKYFVMHRVGEYKRCMSYCSVSHGCPHLAAQREVE